MGSEALRLVATGSTISIETLVRHPNIGDTVLSFGHTHVLRPVVSRKANDLSQKKINEREQG
jgi:hypothetical protein